MATDMTTGFSYFDLPLIWRQGQDFLLPEGLAFGWRGGLFRHRPGGHTDGLSSPKWLHVFPDADSDQTWAFLPAVAHDGAYHDDIEQFSNGAWKHFPMSKEDADTLFRELMATLAVTEKQKLEAVAFYEAVHLGGQTAFDEDRKQVQTSGQQ